MRYVTQKLPLKTGAMSQYLYTEELEHLYTFDSTYEEKVCGAVREGNTIYVPRESVPYALQPEDYRTSVYPSLDTLPLAFNPRHEQLILADQSLALLRQGQNHIFEAPTGWGKTVVGSYIASCLAQPTLIVVTKEDLMDQWKDSLVNLLGISPSLIGHVQGGKEDWKGKRFVLGMVQSLMINEKYTPEFFKYFGFLLLDEVHQMAADCFVRVCQRSYAKYRLGFSATPNRKDGKSKLLQWHIGPVMVKGKVMTVKPKILVRNTGWAIPYVKRRVDGELALIPIPHAPGRMMPVITAMASNDVRNMEIVNFVVQAYEAGRQVLIMSDTLDHLTRLFQMLTGEGIPGNEIGHYIGGLSKFELDSNKKRRVILATYKMCSTGTDVPKWDTLVLATPRADVRQAIGRVLRAVVDKKQPVILDLVDKNKIFHGFHSSRLKQYYEVGAEIVKIS